MGALCFHRVRVFTGTETLACASVVVRGGVIEAVGDLPLPDDAATIDGRGLTLLPGLIDAHVHAFDGSLEQAVLFGVTTELDMLADPGAIFRERDRAASHAQMADVRSAGTGVTVPGGYPWYLVELGYLPPFPTLADPRHAEAFVAARLAEGSDYVKVFLDDGVTTGMPCPPLERTTLERVVRAAHDARRLVVAHALTSADAALAIECGVDVLGHLFVDGDCPAQLVDAIVARDVAVIPTLCVLDGLFGEPHGPELLEDELLAPYLDQQSRDYLAMGKVELGAGARHDVAIARAALRSLTAAGATILAGTDAGNPDTAHGASMHLELRLLVEAGLTAVEALTAATAATADRFGLDDRGRVVPGLRADLLLVAGDPTARIGDTRRITGVWRGGERIDRRPVA